MDRYLSERAAQLLDTPTAVRIAEIEQKHIVEHSRYTFFRARIQKLFDTSPQFGIGGMLFVGPSGMGKSQLLYDFYLDNPNFTNDDGDIEIPVVYFPLNAVPSPKNVITRLIDVLRIPLSLSASYSAMETTTFRKLRAVKTRMIIIDEIQHSENTITKPQQAQFLNLIKDIGNMLHIPVVICGIKPALKSIEDDSQLIRRFHPFDVFPPWTFSNESRNLIADIESLLPLRHPSDLHQTMSTQMILDKTHGITDFMIEYIKKAGIAAIEDGSEKITEESLRELEWIIPEKSYEIASNQLPGVFTGTR